MPAEEPEDPEEVYIRKQFSLSEYLCNLFSYGCKRSQFLQLEPAIRMDGFINLQFNHSY